VVSVVQGSAGLMSRAHIGQRWPCSALYYIC